MQQVKVLPKTQRAPRHPNSTRHPTEGGVRLEHTNANNARPSVGASSPRGLSQGKPGPSPFAGTASGYGSSAFGNGQPCSAPAAHPPPAPTLSFEYRTTQLPNGGIWRWPPALVEVQDVEAALESYITILDTKN